MAAAPTSGEIAERIGAYAKSANRRSKSDAATRMARKGVRRKPSKIDSNAGRIAKAMTAGPPGRIVVAHRNNAAVANATLHARKEPVTAAALIIVARIGPATTGVLTTTAPTVATIAAAATTAAAIVVATLTVAIATAALMAAATTVALTIVATKGAQITVALITAAPIIAPIAVAPIIDAITAVLIAAVTAAALIIAAITGVLIVALTAAAPITAGAAGAITAPAITRIRRFTPGATTATVTALAAGTGITARFITCFTIIPAMTRSAGCL